MVRVSVIIPTYNSVRYISQTIESVIAQTFKNHEIIIVDGGSTDGTLDVLNSYGSRLKVLSQDGKGISNARNVGILASQGEYIAFLDSDDLWLPNKLESQVKFMDEKPPTVGMIYSDVFIFREKGISRFDYLANKRAFQIGKPHRGRILKQLLLMGNFIPAPTVIVRKTCFEKVGLFDESLPLSEDADMWMRIAEHFDIDYQDEVLAHARLHKGSITHTRKHLLRSKIVLRTRTDRLLKRIAGAHGLDSASIYRIRNKEHLNSGVEYLLSDEIENAKLRFRQYIKTSPYNIYVYFLLILTFLPFSLCRKLRIFRYVSAFLAQKIHKQNARGVY